MRFNFSRKAENDLLNPNAVRERTLSIAFKGNKILRSSEYDLGRIAGNSLPFVFLTAAIDQFSAGNTGTGLMLSVVPALSILGRSQVMRDENNEIVPRYQDMDPEAVARREQKKAALEP